MGKEIMSSFTVESKDEEIYKIAGSILEEVPDRIDQICERYGSGDEDVRYYDVYHIHTTSGDYMLKKAGKYELFNYENYLKDMGFSVPMYLGGTKHGEDTWIIIERVEGEDLRNMTDDDCIAVSGIITQIQNYYWMDTPKDLKDSDRIRYDAYVERIRKRYAFLKEDNVIKRAYKEFLDRQLDCPVTLSNGDLMQFNVMRSGDRRYIIDWGFGGIMPYSLDIARFIAHATPDRATFPFCMNDEQKSLFIDSMYEKMQHKPEYNRYLRDIKLAILNEYVEFVEADEDEDGWYYEHAFELAKELLYSLL